MENSDMTVHNDCHITIDHHKIYDFILKHFPFFWETWAEDKSRALANNKGEIEDSLNLFVPNAPFSSSWKRP